ncbi:MAG: hypothetical protein AB1Z17_11910, partial [Lutibacter sp.]
MKKILSFLFICTFILGYSQQKELTLEDAVLGYYKGLYPISLSNLKWVENTNNYVFEKENEFIFTDAKTAKIVKKTSLEDLKKAYPQLQRMPYIQEVDASSLAFRTRNTIELFNYE